MAPKRDVNLAPKRDVNLVNLVNHLRDKGQGTRGIIVLTDQRQVPSVVCEPVGTLHGLGKTSSTSHRNLGRRDIGNVSLPIPTCVACD